MTIMPCNPNQNDSCNHRTKSSTFHDLPEEVVLNIFNFFEYKSLLNFQLVNRQWKARAEMVIKTYPITLYLEKLNQCVTSLNANPVIEERERNEKKNEYWSVLIDLKNHFNFLPQIISKTISANLEVLDLGFRQYGFNVIKREFLSCGIITSTENKILYIKQAILIDDINPPSTPSSICCLAQAIYELITDYNEFIEKDSDKAAKIATQAIESTYILKTEENKKVILVLMVQAMIRNEDEKSILNAIRIISEVTNLGTQSELYKILSEELIKMRKILLHTDRNKANEISLKAIEVADMINSAEHTEIKKQACVRIIQELMQNNSGEFILNTVTIITENLNPIIQAELYGILLEQLTGDISHIVNTDNQFQAFQQRIYEILSVINTANKIEDKKVLISLALDLSKKISKKSMRSEAVEVIKQNIKELKEQGLIFEDKKKKCAIS